MAKRDRCTEVVDELISALRNLIDAAAEHERENGPGTGLAFVAMRIECHAMRGEPIRREHA